MVRDGGAVQGGTVQDGAMRAAQADGAGGARGAGRRGQAKMCGCGGQVCPAGRAAAESRERPWETAACLHNIVNCTAFMLKSLLAMWKNGFHNADFGRETRQSVRRYPYRSRKSEQQNGNCI
jgi:hypothetical protein